MNDKPAPPDTEEETAADNEAPDITAEIQKTPIIPDVDTQEELENDA